MGFYKGGEQNLSSQIAGEQIPCGRCIKMMQLWATAVYISKKSVFLTAIAAKPQCVS